MLSGFQFNMVMLKIQKPQSLMAETDSLKKYKYEP